MNTNEYTHIMYTAMIQQAEQCCGNLPLAFDFSEGRDDGIITLFNAQHGSLHTSYRLMNFCNGLSHKHWRKYILICLTHRPQYLHLLRQQNYLYFYVNKSRNYFYFYYSTNFRIFALTTQLNLSLHLETFSYLYILKTQSEKAMLTDLHTVIFFFLKKKTNKKNPEI